MFLSAINESLALALLITPPRSSISTRPPVVCAVETGYKQTWERRRDSAMVGGFVVGVLVLLGGLAIYFAIPSNSDSAQHTSTTAVAAPPPGGMTVRF